LISTPQWSRATPTRSSQGLASSVAEAKNCVAEAHIWPLAISTMPPTNNVIDKVSSSPRHRRERPSFDRRGGDLAALYRERGKFWAWLRASLRGRPVERPPVAPGECAGGRSPFGKSCRIQFGADEQVHGHGARYAHDADNKVLRSIY
jgi:hypothetical protein